MYSDFPLASMFTCKYLKPKSLVNIDETYKFSWLME